MREISGSTTGVVIGYLRRVHGEATVERVLAAAGETRAIAEIEDTNSWCSYRQAVALFEAAAQVTGDPAVARRAGEELLRQHAGTEVAALLRALGSPGEILRNVATTAAKYSTVTRMEAVDVGEAHATITARTPAPATRHPHFCRFTEGVLSQASAMFGLEPAAVRELECQTRGEPACVYLVTWDEDREAAADPVRRAAFLEGELAALTERFEALQATATELVAARDVDCTLEAITRRAGLAVRAPQFVLAVRVSDDDPLRVHSIGVAPDREPTLAQEILADEPDDRGGSRLVVDVVAGDRRFGRLAALYPDGGGFFAQERRLLESYAAHAAAALETAAALDSARRRDRTARTLLDLAHSLADIGSRQEVASKIAQAVGKIVDCDQVGVWLWDEEAGALVMGAIEGMADGARAALTALEVRPSDTPVLADLLVRQRPTFASRSTKEAFIRSLLELAGLAHIAVVPMVAAGTFYGAVVAGVEDDPSRLEASEDVIERLGGLARHGATALRNASLIDQVRHQALHDELTSLPNQRLLDDRVTQALEQARRDRVRVALLFIDLDGFKQVNDTFGHGAGDAVLRQVATRLRDALRVGDTVARLGGDEFAVLLPRVVDDAAAAFVAAKLQAALEAPFDIDGQPVRIGASIGTALYPDTAATLPELLRAADAAMYDAKREVATARR